MPYSRFGLPVSVFAIAACTRDNARSLQTICVFVGGKRRASLVWNEAFAAGKPFPEKKVPIQVWSLGRFKFKGIAGTCEVTTLSTFPLYTKLFHVLHL